MRRRSLLYSEANNPNNSLVSYWKPDTSSLSSLVDVVSGYNGSPFSSIGLSTSQLVGDRAVTFNNSDSRYEVAHDDDLSFVNRSFSTVSLVNFNSLASSSTIYDKSLDASNKEYFKLFSTGGFNPDRLRGSVHDSTDGGVLRTSNDTALSISTWYVVTKTFNHNTNTLKVYLDNNLTNVYNDTGTYTTMRNTGGKLYIGNVVTYATSSNNFKGLFNALGIYDKELSAAEVGFNVDKFLVDNEHLI